MTLISGPILLAAAAAAAPEQTPAVVAAITACRTVQAEGERLACYDRAVGDFEKARADRTVLVVDQEQIRKTRRSLFGLSLPDIRLFAGDDEDDDAVKIREVNSTVRQVAPTGYDLFNVGLADGSVWRLNEKPFDPPKPGDAIRIFRGPLGNYLASFNGRRSLRIRRER